YPPDATTFGRIPGWLDEVAGLSIGRLLLTLNERLVAEGIEDDRAIGHALLSIPSDSTDAVAALRRRFRFDIYPLILEYCYMDRSRVRRILGGLADGHGRLIDLSDAEFMGALRSLSRSLPSPALATDKTGPLEDTSDEPDEA